MRIWEDRINFFIHLNIFLVDKLLFFYFIKERKLGYIIIQNFKKILIF